MYIIIHDYGEQYGDYHESDIVGIFNDQIQAKKEITKKLKKEKVEWDEVKSDCQGIIFKEIYSFKVKFNPGTYKYDIYTIYQVIERDKLI